MHLLSKMEQFPWVIYPAATVLIFSSLLPVSIYSVAAYVIAACVLVAVMLVCLSIACKTLRYWPFKLDSDQIKDVEQNVRKIVPNHSLKLIIATLLVLASGDLFGVVILISTFSLLLVTLEGERDE